MTPGLPDYVALAWLGITVFGLWLWVAYEWGAGDVQQNVDRWVEEAAQRGIARGEWRVGLDPGTVVESIQIGGMHITTGPILPSLFHPFGHRLSQGFTVQTRVNICVVLRHFDGRTTVRPLYHTADRDA